ncbi:MAG: lytic transglycosylase domain-containing protein [Candidimonas sp.]|jgi:soluble lytic murein transglycosylase-like protein
MNHIVRSGLVGRSARGVLNPLSEFVHVCAIYLGIAVLVSIALGLFVPSMREQTVNLREVVLDALRPVSLAGDADAAIGSDWATFGAAPSAERSEQDARASDSARESVPASQSSFSRAMRAAIANEPIRGVSSQQLQALRSYIARKYKIAPSVAGALISTVFAVGREYELDPQLLLAVIAIESRYNPYAESHAGAQGLMQVMTHVHKEKFEEFSDGVIAALNPIANIRVGSRILYDCIKRRGSVEGGLACYVGATGPNDGGYGAKVLAERRRIALASGVPVGR